MAPATAQQIQDAVRKFLDGGSAREIYNLADRDKIKALVESAGVVDKLVDLLVHDKPAGEGRWALQALYYLVLIGEVAQDAIAHAHDGAIFAWLAGPQDHGRAGDKDSLITNFTNNHPANTIRLEAARGNTAELAMLVLLGLQSDDKTIGSLAMNTLIDLTRGKGTASTISDCDFVLLASVMDWDPTNTDATVATIRDQAESLLVQHLHVEGVEDALSKSPSSVADHLQIVKSDPSNSSRSKPFAVLRLKRCVREDGSAALEIVSSDAFPAVADILRCVDSDGIFVAVLRKFTMHLLESMAKVSARVRDWMWDSGAVTSMIHLSRSKSVPEKAAALDALRVFLRDEGDTSAIAQAHGIPFLFQLCRYDMQHASKQVTPMVKILTTLLVGHEDATNGENQSEFVGCDGSIHFLVHVLMSKSGDEVLEFRKNLGSLVPLLLKGLQVPTTKQIDNLPCDTNSITREKGSSDPILARLMSQLARLRSAINAVVWSLVSVELAISTSRSRAPRATTKRLMNSFRWETFARMRALRVFTSLFWAFSSNLMSVSIPLCRWKRLWFFRMREKISSASKTTSSAMKQKEAATAVLGNLAFLRDNCEKIVARGGIGVLVDFLDEASTLQQVETAAAALWVVVDDQAVGRVAHTGAAAVVQKAVKGHPQHDMIWACRLRARLMAMRQTVRLGK